MAAEEVKAFPTPSEVNHPRLIRMQLEPKIGQDLPGHLQGHPRLTLRAAQHDEIVRPADKLADMSLADRAVEGVQVDVREQRWRSHRPEEPR